MDRQLKEQLSRDALLAMLSANVRLEQNRLLRRLPLKLKCAGLRTAFLAFGARSSSITLSNLGALELPEAIRPYIRHAGLLLTPRLYGAYNCGAVSWQGKLYLGFTRNCPEPELEQIFLRRLSELGQQAETDLLTMEACL